ncbi:peptide/nickel transport system permease protein [Angulomicrobium tetraedrale]|uniref:Peptide/nickel transport system permease protein n=1 Tax=Ancylobacter tetraedralis TaxID=217068 RepID=A0A839ZGQ2_9HYPH|nr:ABC transporter permease [Ancylobacter tetraedralis]MBB3773767.1 peptide/nickel transport system permease protein [Ancylobacter tetraedralis]
MSMLSPPATAAARARPGTTVRNAALGILAFWLVIAVIGPSISPHPPDALLSSESFARVEGAGFLGTDYLGRDLLSRLLNGARTTLGLALVASVAAFVVGIAFGFLAGLTGAGRPVDVILSRIVDVLMSFPALILALVVLGTIGTSTTAVVSIVAVVEATRVFRLSRALCIDLGVVDFVQVARARGEGLYWLATREILPNCSVPLMAEFGLRYTYSILMISSLSFLGLGVQPPEADWGVMVHENIQGLLYGSPAALVPAACIASVTIALNLLVDHLIHQANIRLPREIAR